ncbi:FecR family protein [Novosphingobium kaempferiae]|uniref:FecR family protein n=1 Tax=Novosphingobium kaempferiae TaxID=2896849 RepID=UPI001E393831|nr:FecR domain-containing protein [Novosphingobium kaempferiae]
MMDSKQPAADNSAFRNAAAEWFAVMRGPDAEHRRSEFDAWLAASPAHRHAYNRIAETFSYGKFLKNDEALSKATACNTQGSRGIRGRKVRAAFALGAVIVVCCAVSFLWAAPTATISPNVAGGFALKKPNANSTTLTNKLGPRRSFQLIDGSTVMLDTGSVLLVSFDEQHRNLRVVSGHVRFEVAHEARPFMVAAGRGAVTARGTIFDVTVAASHDVTVELLKGSVDVDFPHHGQDGRPNRVRLRPGEHFAFADVPRAQPELGMRKFKVSTQGSARVREYEKVRLADLLSEANRTNLLPVHTASSDLDTMTVSGTFRLAEPHELARSLAQLLGLSLVTSSTSLMLTRSCNGFDRETCQPPS